jgi:hypothetical protein
MTHFEISDTSADLMFLNDTKLTILQIPGLISRAISTKTLELVLSFQSLTSLQIRRGNGKLAWL